MHPAPLSRFLIPHLPFHYAWLVLGALCLAGFARQGPAVAVLSVFVEPMTREFGWSRTAISGAVSLGGVLAAVISPWIGPMVDRRGARATLCIAVLLIGVANIGLSLIDSLLLFYLLFCFARMIWAGPFDIGLYAALNNWFVARRGIANSILSLAQMSGLVALPLIAQFAMLRGDWRDGWVAVGILVLVTGFLPVWLLLVRRPEDIGLLPDKAGSATEGGVAEPRFTRKEALGTRAFWLLAGFTMLVYPVQAGVSLHQAPHLIERGLQPMEAAAVVSVFSTCSAIGAFGLGLLPRGALLRWTLAGSGALLSLGTFGMLFVHGAHEAFVAAALFGLGIGGVVSLLPVAWADYFGRNSYGAIRGVVLSLQVSAQAIGPLLSGILRDLTGDYRLSLEVFGVLAALGVAAALLAQRPQSTA